MTSILITGGGGFIGKHLCKQLCSQNFHVTIFDNFSSSSYDDLLEEISCLSSLKVVRGDIIDKESLNNAFSYAKPEIVIHLAAIVSVQESLDNPEIIQQVNIEGTINVLEVSEIFHVKKFIFASSAAVYGSLLPPLDESMVTPEPEQYAKLLSPYAVSKLRGEEEVLKSKINSTIFRIFNVYGKGQKKGSGYAAVIPEFLSRCFSGRDLVIFGDGRQTRDFIAVQDVARAFKTAIDRIDVKGIFNLASGRGVSLHYLISVLEKMTHRVLPVSYNASRSGDIKESYADVTRIKQMLGFEPQISLESGIAQMIHA